MKKIFVLIPAVALALVSCVKTQDVYTGAPESREISFSPLAQLATKTVLQESTFPTANDIEIAAYQSSGSAGTYFAKTTFRYKAASNPAVWNGGKYWPLSPATINFFALSGAGVHADDMTIAEALASAQVQYKTSGNTSSSEYSKDTQSDIMYAFNRASVSQSGNTLSFPNVSMSFKHALALVNFQIKGSAGITVTKIELNGAHYTGQLEITNTNASSASGDYSAQLDWSPDGVVNNVQVPIISALSLGSADFYPASNSTWAALMIIPSQQKTESPVSYGFTNFKITYSIGGRSYEYIYEPTIGSLTPVDAGKMYTYQITMTLHEIEVAPSVTDWNTDLNGNSTDDDNVAVTL